MNLIIWSWLATFLAIGGIVVAPLIVFYFAEKRRHIKLVRKMAEEDLQHD